MGANGDNTSGAPGAYVASLFQLGVGGAVSPPLPQEVEGWILGKLLD